jgi:glycosyltransferase involved in cell wall biosynthesis
MRPALSVVMPVHDEAEHLPATLAALARAAEKSGLDVELVLVDDGSTDGSGAVAAAALGGAIPLHLLTLPHAGRFKARRAGVEAAGHDRVLLLDARVRLEPDALQFLAEHLTPRDCVWNGHVTADIKGNPFGAFGEVLVRLAWSAYFDDPKPTSFGVDDFDYFPKGTGCFVAPRQLLLAAMDAFVPRVADWRFVSDDTQLIRWIAARHPIHLSPGFACVYQPRTTFRAFVRNAVYRGSTFLDGHGRRDSRLYPVAVAFYPVSAAVALLLVRRPLLLPALVVTSAAGAGVVAARAQRSRFETLSFAALAPVYLAGHAAGMWRGLAALARGRMRA